MTTSQTPERVIRRQAITICKSLKLMEAKEGQGSIPKDAITFAILQDDKLIKMTMTWDRIRKTSEEGLVEYIVKFMKGQKDNVGH